MLLAMMEKFKFDFRSKFHKFWTYRKFAMNLS
jgi:hypothetical protein